MVVILVLVNSQLIIGELVEESDDYILERPRMVAPVQGPNNQGPVAMFAPLGIPIKGWVKEQRHVSIARSHVVYFVEPDDGLRQAYTQAVTGLVVAQQTPPSSLLRS